MGRPTLHPHLGRGRGGPRGDRWPAHAAQGEADLRLGAAIHQPEYMTTCIHLLTSHSPKRGLGTKRQWTHEK